MHKVLLNINYTLAVFAVFFLVLKVIFIFSSGPLPDEAYYWLWSKNIGLSYYDHPPLTSWVQYSLSLLLPNNILEVRALPFLCFLIICFINIKWMMEIKKRKNIALLNSTVIFFSLPLYGILLTIAFPDALMVLLLFLSGFLFYKFYSARIEGKDVYKLWYLSTLCFSLACITKYNAIVFGIGILIFMWSQRPTLRSMFLSRHIIFSVFIFLFIQLPVLIWNLENQFSSFQFHLNKRMDTELSTISFVKNTITFISATVLSLSPLAAIYLYTKKNKLELCKVDQLAMSCAYYVLLVTICSCILLSIFTNVLYYWSIVGFILFLPYLSLLFRKPWEVIFQLCYGLAFLLLLTINSGFLPLTIFSGKVDRETAIVHKWEQVIKQISNFQKINEVEDIVFTDYRIASLYSFHSGNTKVDALMQNRETQFDIWRSKKQFYPIKSLIIADRDFPIHRKLTTNFREITYLGQIETTKYNRKIKNFDVYLAKK
ncbi:glycosyltransferase family 39 protein [Paracoccaceae bacterium]|nr:glycosyltransferase family 39 protein [Paracoccaceae bacterium]